MALRIEIGQYYAADSPVHSLDARAKLCCALGALIALFCVSNAAQLAVAAAFTLAVLVAARVPAGRVLASVRPLVVFLAVLSLFNLFFVQSGDVLVPLGPLAITTGGIRAAVLYTARFALALVLGSLVLLTTTPTQLADAFDAMLSPLSRVGLPGHEIAMVFSLMLRFVPTIADETSAIMDAQALRGGAFDEGGPVRRVRSVVPVVVALLASGLRHADGLARALDARCYEGGAGRTHYHEQRLTVRDLIAAALTAAFILALALLG
ncbi:energy-coupling factor transporter transmembrane protein EcfT [Olsenella uli]|uniref:energy-coupling factor transporter transmembrane component T family protein n=1 Tax=Olsenella uli TaxID=133926 RepID=UPI001959FAF7|nr:energy-coupling factor transporter transmembrane component T [Olsenella uli]MBM6676457.1 energy-coupling factor transporter transmembrane protein EcfT [Olsenella uli]